MLIIDNKNFKADLNDRLGTDTDCQKLEDMFANFGFLVHVEKNATALVIILFIVYGCLVGIKVLCSMIIRTKICSSDITVCVYLVFSIEKHTFLGHLLN